MDKIQWQRHQQVLKQVLLGAFADTELLTGLAFKGGTCLYLFYDLPRLSVDLDFDWIGDNTPVKAMSAILDRYMRRSEFSDKKSTWFWVNSYEKDMMKVKVEINKRHFSGNSYELKDYLGVKVRMQTPECMLAHKLCAIKDRKTLQNRDMFDAWWMLEKRWPINAEIIQECGSCKCKIIALLDQVFPEYEKLFSDTFGKASKELLLNYQTPEDMLVKPL
jgi:predicted nucleotidyltransferase component of viral defense system